MALSPQQHRWPFARPAWARFVTAPKIAQQHNCGPIRTVNASQAMMPRRTKSSFPFHPSYATARGRTSRGPVVAGVEKTVWTRPTANRPAALTRVDRYSDAGLTAR